MAFKKCINEICGTVLVLFTLLSSASAVDCHGKSFHCVNSTHFIICVDLGGGVSHSIDNFLIPCPPPTVCQGTNHFECEFHAPTTPIATLTNVIIETTQPWEDVVVTTNSPQKKSTKEYSEKYINTESLMSFADSFTKDATFDYTTEVAPSSLTDVNSQTNKTETIPVTTESLYDTTIVPALTESTFNDTATGLEQVTEIIVENIVKGATEVITDISLIETTIAEPNNTQVNTETTGFTTISSDDNLNLPISRENSTTTDTTSGGVLDYTGVDVLRTDLNQNAEQTDGYTTVVNILNTEQSELTAADVVQRSEYTIISEQITTTDSTFDTKSVNTDQPETSILPVMIADATTNLATPRQSSLPDYLQNVFEQSPTTIDTVFSYDSLTYKQDVNEVGSTTDASNFAQNGVTEQSTSNSNDIYTTEIPFTAATNDQTQLLLTDNKYFITESSTLYNNETSWSAGNVSTTNNTQKETNETMTNHGEVFTHKTGLVNYSIEEEKPKATVDYPIKKNINAKRDRITITYDTQILQPTGTTEQPVTLADSFQTVANELPLTDSSQIYVTNDPVILNFKGDEALSTEKIPVIKDDTKFNIEKHTQHENLQDRANTSGYVNKVVPEQPNTNTFENTVTTETTVDLPITTSIVSTSEISDTISQTLSSTGQPITITFEEKYQTVGNYIYITEPSTIFTTNNQEPQQMITEPNNLPTQHSTTIENIMQTETTTENTSTISDITSTPATDPVPVTIEVVTEESNINKSQGIFGSHHSVKPGKPGRDRSKKIEDKMPATEISKKEREEINIIDTPKRMATVTTYNSTKEIEKPVSILYANIVQSDVNETNIEGKLLADKINDNAFIANTTVSTTVPNNVKQNTMSSETDTNTNVNGNIATVSAVSITERNYFIQSTLPRETDTIPSVNENIVTTSDPSTADPKDLKQNTVSRETHTNNNENGIIAITSATSTTIPNNLKQNTMPIGSETNTNKDGNNVTPSALSITDQNDFIPATLPHETDTIPSVNQSIVTTSAQSTIDPKDLKQNTVSRETDTNNSINGISAMSSGSDTNTNENGIIATPSALPITDLNDFIQTTVPHGTDTISSVNENIVTTSDPSTTDPNVLEQNTVSRRIDTKNNVNGIIVTNSAMSISEPNDLERIILEHQTEIITNVIENIVTTSAPSIADLKNLKQNNAPHGTDIIFPSVIGNIALSEQQMVGSNDIETKMMNVNNFKTTFTSKLEDQTIGNNLIATTNLNEVEDSTRKLSDSKLNDHKDVNHFIKSNSGSTIATQLENLAPSNEIYLTEEYISSITENPQGITDTTTRPSTQNIQYANSLSTSEPAAIDVTNNKYQNNYIHISKPAPSVEKDVHGTTVSFTSTINRIKGDEDLINQNNEVTTQYANTKWTGMPTSSGVITDTNNLISNRLEKNAFVQFNNTSEPSTEPGVFITDAFNDKTFTTSEPLSPVPTKGTKTKSTILENVQTVRYTITNLFNTASENSTQGARADSNSETQSGTEIEISSKPTAGNNYIKTESDPSIVRPSINIINVTQSSSTIQDVNVNIKWETTEVTPISKSAGKSTVEAQSAISQNNTSKLTSTTKADLGNSSTAIKRTSASQTAVINDSSLLILQNSTNSGTAHDSKLQQSAQSTQSVVVTKKTVPKVINPVAFTQTSTERIIPKIVSPVIENPKKQVTNNISRNYTCINGIRGRHSDKDHCRKFYICVGSTQPVIGHCPLNTVFSDIKKLCTKNMSHCIRENEFKCPSDGRFSDVAKENVYFICVSHKNHLYRFKFQCQSGFTLNKTTVRCVENKEIESNESVSISISESADDSSSNKISSGTSSGSTRSGSTSSSSSGSIISSSSGDSDSSSSKNKINKEKPESKDEEDDDEVFECEKAGKFPVPNDCTRYYLCKKNRKSQFRRKLKKCESGDVFHKSKKRCVDADSYEC